MGKCVFGFDFGTLSCRGVAIDLNDGRLIATAEMDYPKGVISGRLPGAEEELPPEWFLQDPMDWLESMRYVSKTMLKEGNIAPKDVLAIGTDFTSCTLLPAAEDRTPLCFLQEFKNRPNAWPKLWKHHGAQKYAEQIEAYAKENTTWLKEYFGNSVSSEWVFPKVMEVLKEDPEVYDRTAYFMEAVDWIVFALTGELTRNYGILGVNAFWIKGKGFPEKEFLKGLSPELENIAETKLKGRLLGVGERAGYLTKEMADYLGLTVNTVVSSGHGDSAVAGCGAGINKSGSMILVMGTSTCHQMLYKDFNAFDGVCSIAADGMVPGLYSYESGQSATGDVFGWFAKNCVPEEYRKEARTQNKKILDYLSEKASALKVGESGLVALDWLNGNRSVLSDYNLSGLVVGLTLSTKPEEIYRAFVEANLFGSRVILENYENGGVKIDRVYAVGGIPAKSKWVMQLCADILDREISVPEVDNIPARGSAACAAVALGGKYGCKNFEETADRLIPKGKTVYKPDPERVKQYNELYKFYIELHDGFGRNSTFMKRLKELRTTDKSQ